MAITINTNIASMVAQKNLTKATNSLNQAIERMTTGYKINRASDNAAGYSIAKNWETKLSSLDVAADNAATGADMLKTMEDNYSLITSHLQRVRDLTEQAANGTYGSDSKVAIQAEIEARLKEVDRIAANCEFNGVKLMDGSRTTALNLQVGLDSTANSKIALDATLFAKGNVVGLFGTGATATSISEKCTGIDDAHTDPSTMLTQIDTAIKNISGRVTKVGAANNSVESAIEQISVQSENITSSLSTLKDADVASESSKYIQAQILQQAAATLLSTANQTPSIALNLI